MSSLGFRILPVAERVRPELVEQYRQLATPLISDNMNRLHGNTGQLRLFHRGGKLVGTALTVRTRPGDNLMVHKALDLAEPGDVIVVDAAGDLTNAIVGEIMMSIALQKGIRGFVIDGAIRDVSAFVNANFPVYARGVTHRGPYKDGPGEINVPVTVCGMMVSPGDIVVGDEDGLIAVPREFAESVYSQAMEQKLREQSTLQSIQQGTLDRSWVDATLRQKGCNLDD